MAFQDATATRPAPGQAVRGPFGSSLRHWRLARGLSQLEMADRAATTARHVSFLETGRSRPGREMVLRLGGTLDLSLRDHNGLLQAAGFAPEFAETPLESADLTPFRAAIAQMLTVHDPYPAFVLDRHWNIVETNSAAARMVAASSERNLVRLTYAEAWRGLIDNWAPVAWAGLSRLRADLAANPGDPVLAELVAVARGALADEVEPATLGGDRVICPNFRFGEQVIRTIGVVAHFQAPRDVTLAELRVELMYPADPEAEAFFRDTA